MMSKVSFFKLMKEDVTRRSWLLAIISVVLFIAKPVVTLFSVESMMDSVKYGYMTLAQVQEQYRDMVGINQDFSDAFLIIPLAALIGITGYVYLHSRVQQDFYHSLAVKRQKWFLVQFTGGILIMAVPYFICTLLSLLIGAANGIIGTGIFFTVVTSFVINVLGFFVIYLTSILAMLMSGKIVVGAIGFITFLLYGPGLVYVMEGLVGRFFSTYFNTRNLGDIISITSPMTLWIQVIEKWQTYQQETAKAWLYLGILILLIVVLIGVCIWLNTKRKTEAAGHSMAFPKSERVIKVMLVIPLALATGLLLSRRAHSNFEVWFFTGIVFGAVLIDAVIEFIYHLDIREIFAHKLQLLLTVLATVMVGCILQFDLTGYDSYLPAREDVEQMALYSHKINGSFAYNLKGIEDLEEDEYYVDYSEQSALDATAISDFGPIYELVRKSSENAESGSEDGYYFSVKYILKSGKSVYRSYWTHEEADMDQCEQSLFTQDEYKQKIYPIFNRNEADIRGIYLATYIKDMRLLELTAKQKKTLLETYKTELLNSTYADFCSGNMVAGIRLELGPETQVSKRYDEYGYPVSKNFTKTLDLLNEYGYPAVTGIDAENVSGITVYNYDTGQNTNYSSEEDIIEILEAFYTWNISDYDAGSENIVDRDVNITLKDNTTVNGYFKKGNIPSCISIQ